MDSNSDSTTQSFSNLVKAASIDQDTWRIDSCDNAYELAVLVASGLVPVRFNDLLGHKLNELTDSAPTEQREQILEGLAKNAERTIPADLMRKAIRERPLSFFLNPLIVEEEFEASFRQLLERLIVNPAQVTFCFDNPALARRPEVMAAATKAWDSEKISGNDFSKLLESTTESALPRHVLDKLFELFTDPENINPPWAEALAMLNNPSLKYSKEQVKALLESSDPELYIAGLENEEDMLTWQDWKKVSTSLNQEVANQFNRNESPLSELQALTDRIQHKAQEKIQEQQSDLLFSDFELMDWFLMGPDRTAQSVVVNLLIQMGTKEKDLIHSEDLLQELTESNGDINSYNLANAAILIGEIADHKQRQLG